MPDPIPGNPVKKKIENGRSSDFTDKHSLLPDSLISGFMAILTMRFTAAGTVQDSHLIPFHGHPPDAPLPQSRCKDTLFIRDNAIFST